MRIILSQNTEGVWCLQVGETVTEYGTDKAAAIFAMLAAGLASTEDAPVTVGPDGTALAEANDSASATSAGPALRAERWMAGPNGICMAGPTGPERDFTGCKYTWRDLPLPLMVNTGSDGHESAELAGFITDMFGRSDGGVDASGTFLDNDAGAEAVQVLEGGGRFWCSIDPSEYVDADFVCTEMDDDGWCTAGVVKFTAYEIAGLTLLPFQGFEDCHVVLEGANVAASAGVPVAVASVDLVRPPARWFELDEPEDPFAENEAAFARLVQQDTAAQKWGVPLTITDDGQVFGHVAVWGTCHVGFPGQCVTPPTSASAYAHFHIGETVTDGGGRVPTGSLVCGTDHAAADLLAAEAIDHYAHTGLAWASVRATNGVHGVWVCGALRPGLTPEQVVVLRASALSGDWRRRNGTLEMIAALSVPIPGFPISREAITASGIQLPEVTPVRASSREGVQISLVASGIVRPAPPVVEALVAAGTVVECDDCTQRADRRQMRTLATMVPATQQSLTEVVDRLARMERLLGKLEVRTRPLLASAAQEAVDAYDAIAGA